MDREVYLYKINFYFNLSLLTFRKIYLSFFCSIHTLVRHWKHKGHTLGCAGLSMMSHNFESPFFSTLCWYFYDISLIFFQNIGHCNFYIFQYVLLNCSQTRWISSIPAFLAFFKRIGFWESCDRQRFSSLDEKKKSKDEKKKKLTKINNFCRKESWTESDRKTVPNHSVGYLPKSFLFGDFCH